MPNAKNLVPNSARTPEERRKNAQKAGIASGEARRRNRTLKQGLERLLMAPVSTATDKKKLAAMGVPVDDMTHEDLMTLALVRKAIDGDVPALREVRAWLGEDTRLPPGADMEADGLFDVLAKKVGEK